MEVQAMTASVVHRVLVGLTKLHRSLNADLLKQDRKSTRLNSSHIQKSRMPSSA